MIKAHLYRVTDHSRRFWTAFSETGVSVAGRTNMTADDVLEALASKLVVHVSDLDVQRYQGTAGADEVAKHRAEFVAKTSTSAEADESAALRERTAIVQWLRAQAVNGLADRIERGEHEESRRR